MQFTKYSLLTGVEQYRIRYKALSALTHSLYTLRHNKLGNKTRLRECHTLLEYTYTPVYKK